MHFRNLFTVAIGIALAVSATAQMSYEAATVTPRLVKTTNIFARVSDSIRSEFQSKGLDWPARFLYIRSFKHEKELEVWVKQDYTEPFRHFKTYKVCATSGTFGPKRKEGDKQIPEGFYYINEFKPNSNYHLALGLNYPNASDQLLSDPARPGGDIYIHGNCVTVGCLPLTDSLIEQVYFLSSVVKEQGQDFIPVHIYPYRFDYPRAAEQYLQRTRNRPELQQFSQPLREAYDYFEDTHQLPAILITKKGGYVVAGNPDAPRVERKKIVEPAAVSGDPFRSWELEEKVDKVPAFKEGPAAYQRWLFRLGQELSSTLAPNTSLSLQVEFVVDKEGNTPLARIQGGNPSINKVVKERFEQQLRWEPAVKNGQPVATRMRQNINLAAPEDLD
ncbi:MAG TPA: hypothetical protein PKE63_03795 [Lacibacter sp.]|nr:hypothetical protein [Lacibacter sp.]HMO89076.1 hypothetical protein [Lacibacter sp.]HMP86373.1 hypothetical protein [Lacibacter sp.]